MLYMFIFHNYEELHSVLGKTMVYFTETEKAHDDVMYQANCALARAEFKDDIPTASRVEKYVKGSSLNNVDRPDDWVFIHSWMAERSRERAILDKYGQNQRG